MSKKSGLTAATNKITGLSGKGPYMAREVMTGSKCMSGKDPGFATKSPAKMSSAHGTNGQSKDHNMGHNTGGYRIGAGCPTFGRSNYRQAGPNGGNTRHASQPSGHKDKA